MSKAIQATELEISEWSGCYKDGWKGLIIEEAFAHPAKYSRGLIRRIYEHAMDEGWLIAGDVIVDPFGGIALGGFDAAINGCYWTGCELESKFVELGNENIAEWQHRYGHRQGSGSVRLIQGDSRKLSEVLRGAGLCVGSPPFSGDTRTQPKNGGPGDAPENHGQTSAGNLGNLRATEARLTVAISSPPYRESLASDDPETRGGLFRDPKRKNDKSLTATYGEGDGQLGAMKEPSEGFSMAVSSPPYAESLANASEYRDPEKAVRDAERDIMRSKAGKASDMRYADQTDGQLGAMRDRGFDLIVSSPPYEAGVVKMRSAHLEVDRLTKKGLNIQQHGIVNGTLMGEEYSDSKDNLGNKHQDDFWSVARQIVEETYKVLAPDAHAIWVVKGFVRKSKYVDFPDQWRQLCEAVGFVTLHWHEASLVEHSGTQHTLDGGEDEIKIERKSFFRRLAESKGSPAIDAEIVLCMRKPS